MSILNNVKYGIQKRAERIIIYGPEGVGKSTLAAGFPNPVVLDTENGTAHIDVPRINCYNFSDIINAIDALAEEKHDFKTVIIDSIDWAERLMIADFLKSFNKKNGAQHKNIEDIGYGKGYKMIETTAMELLHRLNHLLDIGLDVVLVGHSRRVKFEMPETAGAYDKHELNLTKYVSPVVKEWSDAMFFCNFLITVQNGKGQGGTQRMIYTAPAAPWEAKNRHGMPAMMPMDASEVCKYLFPASKTAETVKTAEPEQVSPDWIKLVTNPESAKSFLVYRGVISENQQLADVPESYAEKIRQNPDRFNSAVANFRGE